ncbi:MAG: glycosyl hydrolase 115 family protein, partial [Lachnospiraceae bacterium]|nr:glycosyl hydrolase 115 family protein [Lachnospiraceae bacterium]
FGGFNAKAYEKVFKLLLRLKGNLLWPAMWSSIFSEDGPGEAAVKLADELGIIMGTSHHEPCMRQGEEYRHLRGQDSVYGDDWSFINNRDGITAFWRDGIDKRKDYENVYTVGMRGEADTPILPEGTLADNVSLLHDVIKTQNELLSEVLEKDISDIPRMLWYIRKWSRSTGETMQWPGLRMMRYLQEPRSYCPMITTETSAAFPEAQTEDTVCTIILIIMASRYRMSGLTQTIFRRYGNR